MCSQCELKTELRRVGGGNPQIDIKRIEDATPFVGKKFRVEVTQVDKADQNLVVSRRALLEKQALELKGNALARLSEGEVLKGTVVKTNHHGAFVDLGGRVLD